MSLKDIETFIQNFVQKSIQVIVQSRLGKTEKTQTKCKPEGKDWFNLAIQDIKDISDQITKCLKSFSSGESMNQSLYFLKNDWNICCEISLRSSEGLSLVLEYWKISSRALSNPVIPEQHKLAPFVYQALSRMSIMLKSLITLTRATPAYKIAAKGQSADSYVICYRVYQCEEDFLSEIANSEDSDKSSQFSPIKSLGSIKTICNELSVSLAYRTSLRNLTHSDGNALFEVPVKGAGSGEFLPIKDDHFRSPAYGEAILTPLIPAFADDKQEKPKIEFDIVNTTPFSHLLTTRDDSSDFSIDSPNGSSNRLHTTPSKPISIPMKCNSPKSAKSPQIYSTSNESFVFVEINTPFANEEYEIRSFFSGPSPTFVNSEEDINDINELTNQLAEFDSNISQIDSFVESICLNDSDELDPES